MIPSTYVLHDVLYDEACCRSFLLQEGVFYQELECEHCSGIMRLNPGRWTFRCSTKACRREVIITRHTFFHGTRLKCHEIMNLALLWLNKVQPEAAIGLTGHARQTVFDFYKHFRTLVASSLDEEDQMIGGPGILVQIDESKFGKRKNNRGHHVEGVWILGGVEQTEERKLFLTKVRTRDAATLEAILTRFIRPGSIIVTDLWRGYSGLSLIPGFEQHLTVNHSQYFTDPDTHANTNAIEGSWNGIKLNIRPRSRTWDKIDEHLLEFIWRRKNNRDIWNGFLRALKIVHYND